MNDSADCHGRFVAVFVFVRVTFESGDETHFDIVIGADGLHSNTRSLVFGEERAFIKYLGYCFSGFSIPNAFGLSQEVITYAKPGRMAALYASGDSDTLHALLSFASEDLPVIDRRDAAGQRELTARTFADDGWEIPRLVQAMMEADDLYYDVICQIHMPQWSKGRVALVGDSAFAPSFLSGQGSSLAIVGAYILAGEMATNEEPDAAFAAYEQLMRPFAEANQALAESGAGILLPSTSEELEARNQALSMPPSPEEERQPGNEARAVYLLDNLPDYAAARDSAKSRTGALLE